MKTWQALWNIIRFRPWLYLATNLSILLTSLGYNVPGLVLREVFDSLTGEAPVRFGFWTLIAFLAAAGFARMIGQFGSISSFTIFMYSITALLQKNLLSRIFQRPGAAALPDAPGEVLYRFRGDVEEMLNVPWWIHQVIHGLLMAVIALAIMLSISPYITLVVFVPLTLVVYLTHKASDRIGQYRQAHREATDKVTRFISETFSAVQSIKVANAEEPIVTQFRKLNDTRSRMALKDRLFNDLLTSISSNTVNLGTGVILLLAGRSLQTGAFTVGDFALFVYYLGMVTEPPSLLGTLIAQYRQAAIAFKRLIEVMQGALPKELTQHGPLYLQGELPAISHIHKKSTHRLDQLSVSGLTYHFPGSSSGISDIDFRIERGTFTVITGQIGPGKTTLLRVLQGLLPAESGETRWNHTLVDHPASFFIPPRSAYTPQVPWMFSATLRDNILMDLPENETDLDAALRAAALERDIGELDKGINTVVGPRGVRLSGGQVQRSAAARMFIREAELLIVDDLSSALDVETECILWDRLFKQHDITCLAVSHRQFILRRADQIVVLKEGRVESRGTLEQLLQESEERQRLWKGDT